MICDWGKKRRALEAKPGSSETPPIQSSTLHTVKSDGGRGGQGGGSSQL